jgi:extradiol dioxygenase family protein
VAALAGHDSGHSLAENDVGEANLKFPFHLAVVVDDLAAAREFYGGLLGCAEGRSASHWVDFNFFGHQLVCHLSDKYPGNAKDAVSNVVDGHDVPVPHFGAVLDFFYFDVLAGELRDAQIPFVIEPHVRFKGQPGEQRTMFFLDPSGNAIEIKAFKNIQEQLFAK